MVRCLCHRLVRGSALLLGLAAVSGAGAEGSFLSVPLQEMVALSVRLHPSGSLVPPARLLLIDPLKRRVGWLTSENRMVAEIPTASLETEGIDDDLSGARGAQTEIIDLRKPSAGEYLLTVTGVKSGYYDLEVTGFDVQLNPSRVLVPRKWIEVGQIQKYRLICGEEPTVESLP